MALNWNTKDCPMGGEASDDNEALWRDVLIWASLAVDLGELTEDNRKEWFTRLRILERINKSVIPQTDSGKLVDILVRWTGLRTNVVSLDRVEWFKKLNKTSAQFAERLYEENMKGKA
jgi:hypothetical protein